MTGVDGQFLCPPSFRYMDRQRAIYYFVEIVYRTQRIMISWVLLVRTDSGKCTLLRVNSEWSWKVYTNNYYDNHNDGFSIIDYCQGRGPGNMIVHL